MTVLYICFILYFRKKNCDVLTIRNPTIALKLDTMTQICDKPPPDFDRFRPYSGRYSTNKNTLIASYITVVQ